MKIFLLLFSSALLWGQSATTPPPPQQDPRVGVWSKNKDASGQIRSGDYFLVESYQTLTITREGEDILIVRSTGPRHWCCKHGQPWGASEATERQVTFKCDGTPQHGSKQTITCRYTSANVLEGTTEWENDDTLLPRHRTDYWRSEVSQDGKHLIYSYYKDSGKTKLDGHTVFDRVK
jgi:hypothetical protein